MKSNERLRAALRDSGLTTHQLAEEVGVDAKTVERWITAGRIPYPRHRQALAQRLGRLEGDIWPASSGSEEAPSGGEEVVTLYPSRSAVPSDLWRQLLTRAEEEIGILVYSGLFLSEDAGAHRILLAKAAAGVRIRILLGDPVGQQVARRGEDEGVGDAMAAKIRNALVLYEPLRGTPGIDFRLHDTILYNSIYRADRELLVNTHVYGITAAQAPVIHLRQTRDGSMAATYLDSFERVWTTADPLE